MSPSLPTPGPWQLVGNAVFRPAAPAAPDAPPGAVPPAPNALVAVTTGATWDEARANARLIAAAPALHTALTDLLQILDDIIAEGAPLPSGAFLAAESARALLERIRHGTAAPATPASRSDLVAYARLVQAASSYAGSIRRSGGRR